MPSHNRLPLGENNKSPFSLGKASTLDFFQRAFVFQILGDRVFFLLFCDSPSLVLGKSASSGHGPEFATAGTLASNLCVALWSGCIHLLSPPCSPAFSSTPIALPQPDQSSAEGSPRGWEIPTARSQCTTLNSQATEVRL